MLKGFVFILIFYYSNHCKYWTTFVPNPYLLRIYITHTSVLKTILEYDRCQETIFRFPLKITFIMQNNPQCIRTYFRFRSSTNDKGHDFISLTMTLCFVHYFGSFMALMVITLSSTCHTYLRYGRMRLCTHCIFHWKILQMINWFECLGCREE